MGYPAGSIVLVVTGGRKFDRRDFVFDVLDVVQQQFGVVAIFHGACQDEDGNLRGLDGLADEWARERGVEALGFPADFRRLGRRAGPRRNRKMLEAAADFADECGVGQRGLVFPGNRGTRNCQQQMKRLGFDPWCAWWFRGPMDREKERVIVADVARIKAIVELRASDPARAQAMMRPGDEQKIAALFGEAGQVTQAIVGGTRAEPAAVEVQRGED